MMFATCYSYIECNYFCLKSDAVSVEIRSVNSIILTLLGGSQIYNISYSNTDCPNDTYDDIINITGTTYPLVGLEEGTNYFITVTATLSDRETKEILHNLTATTMSAG